MKKLWAIVLAVSLVLMVWSLYNIYAIPRLHQYVEINPDLEKIDSDISFAKELLIQKAALTLDKNSTNAELHAVNHDYFNKYHISILDGRFPYPNEKDRVVLIDKQTAVKLNGSESPVGKIITVNSTEFRIIGVFDKAPSKVFTQDAYIPFEMAVKGKMQASLITYSADHLVDDIIEFKNKFGESKIWQLSKEKQRGMLLFKLIVYLYSMVIVSLALRHYLRRLKERKYELDQLIIDYYPRQIKLKIFLFICYFVIGLVLIASAYGALLFFIMGGVLSFPEWIPEIIVDYNMIASTYVTNMQNTSSLISLKTNQVLALEHYGKILNIFMVLAMFSISTLLFKRKGNIDND